MRNFHLLSWAALAISLALFAVVLTQAGAVRRAAAAHATRLAEREQQVDRGAYAQRVSAILAETADERAALEDFAQLDVVKVAELLEETGGHAGVTAKVASANEEHVAEGRDAALQPITFSINASGSYAALMHAIELYERLPLPLTIQQLDLDHDQEGGFWSLSLRVRVLTLSSSL